MNSSNDFKPPADDDPYLGSPPEEVETEGGISTGQVTAELNYYAILGVATDVSASFTFSRSHEIEWGT